MPSLKNATQPRDTSKMTPVAPPSQRPQLPMVPFSADPEFSPLSLGPIPTPLGTATDASRQFYRQGVSQVRMPALPAQTSLAVGAQIASHVAAAISEVGPEFSVNNVPNPVQDILNITGTGVSYGPGPGEVSIVSNDDGLDHGTSPWETDPTSVVVNEDFLFGVVTNGSIGTDGWGVFTNTSTQFETGFPPHLGIISFQTGTSQTAPNVLWPYFNNQTYQGAMPLLDYPGWKLSWVWRWVRKADSIIISAAN